MSIGTRRWSTDIRTTQTSITAIRTKVASWVSADAAMIG
jgi:hypothetical protein